jgi:hypothetical protein
MGRHLWAHGILYERGGWRPELCAFRSSFSSSGLPNAEDIPKARKERKKERDREYKTARHAAPRAGLNAATRTSSNHI